MEKDVIGICKLFYKEEGWGWISVEGEEDVWVHFSAIHMDGFKELLPGQQVVFDLEINPNLKEKSRRANNVQLIKL